MLEESKINNALSSPIQPDAQNKTQKKLSSVMIIIYDFNPIIVMTERPSTMNHHAGEISFPGGTWKQDDKDLLETALRETREEIGITLSRSQVIGQLKPVTTLNSGFTITPFITIMNRIPTLVPNSEIESILKIPLIPLLKTMEDDQDPNHKSIQEMHTFKYQNHLIWGASARILKQIATRLSNHGMI